MATAIGVLLLVLGASGVAGGLLKLWVFKRAVLASNEFSVNEALAHEARVYAVTFRADGRKLFTPLLAHSPAQLAIR